MERVSCRTAGETIMTIATLEVLYGGDSCVRNPCVCVYAGPLGHIIKTSEAKWPRGIISNSLCSFSRLTCEGILYLGYRSLHSIENHRTASYRIGGWKNLVFLTFPFLLVHSTWLYAFIFLFCLLFSAVCASCLLFSAVCASCTWCRPFLYPVTSVKVFYLGIIFFELRKPSPVKDRRRIFSSLPGIFLICTKQVGKLLRVEYFIRCLFAFWEGRDLAASLLMSVNSPWNLEVKFVPVTIHWEISFNKTYLHTCLFVCGTTTPSGPGPPHSRGF